MDNNFKKTLTAHKKYTVLTKLKILTYIPYVCMCIFAYHSAPIESTIIACPLVKKGSISVWERHYS